jgi:hypothetical protein
MQDTTSLLEELLRLTSLTPETRIELQDYLEESRTGKLSAGDAKYVAALHKRLTGRAAGPMEAEDEDFGEDLTDELEAARQEIARLRQDRQALHEAFGRRFGPDGLDSWPEAERPIRAAIFAEFQPELERLTQNPG